MKRFLYIASIVVISIGIVIEFPHHLSDGYIDDISYDIPPNRLGITLHAENGKNTDDEGSEFDCTISYHKEVDGNVRHDEDYVSQDVCANVTLGEHYYSTK